MSERGGKGSGSECNRAGRAALWLEEERDDDDDGEGIANGDANDEQEEAQNEKVKEKKLKAIEDDGYGRRGLVAEGLRGLSQNTYFSARKQAGAIR